MKDRSRGIGNSAMGMTFKSIFLGQGRTDSNKSKQLGKIFCFD